MESSISSLVEGTLRGKTIVVVDKLDEGSIGQNIAGIYIQLQAAYKLHAKDDV